jgi:hypothetical protein
VDTVVLPSDQDLERVPVSPASRGQNLAVAVPGLVAVAVDAKRLTLHPARSGFSRL